MITLKELYPIGYVAKAHGIKGELNLALDTEFNPEDFKFLVFDVDGIYVPFTIVNVRGQAANNRLVTIEGVESDADARVFTGKTAYVLIKDLKQHPDWKDDSDGLYLSDLIGFNLLDENDKPIGEIVGFNDDTSNWLLEIALPDGRKVFIPYVDEWVTALDAEKKTISLNLPNGLID